MHAREASAVRRSGTPLVIALALVALPTLAGCGATSELAIPRPAAAPAATSVPRASVASPPGAAPAGSGATGCGPGAWAVIKDHVANPAVALVGVVGGCRQASIETTLDSASVSTGVAICNKAAEVAYALGVSSIVVTAADARELATGVNGSPCSGEP